VLLPGFHPGYNTIRSPVARMQSGVGVEKNHHGASPRIPPKGTSFGAHPGYKIIPAPVARMKSGAIIKKIHHGASFPDSIQATHPDQIAD
jgi:hypothetical protein